MGTPATEAKLRAAFERLKNDAPERIERPFTISPSTVHKEAGLPPGTMRDHPDRYEELFNEIKDYKANLKRLKEREQGLKELSQEQRLRDRLRTTDELRDKYYRELQKANSEVKRLQGQESMLMQAMWDILPFDQKNLLMKIDDKVVTIKKNQKG